MLVVQIPPMLDDQYMGFYFRGLKEEIRLEVLTLDPPNRY